MQQRTYRATTPASVRRGALAMLIVVVAYLGLMAAPAASATASSSAAGLQWPPYRTAPFQLAAGTRCPFALSGTPVRDRERIRTLASFPNGKPRVQQVVGPLIVRYTNTDTGTSVRRNLTGRALVTYGSDGSFTLTLQSGHFAVGLAATDPGGPGFFVLTGRGHSLHVAANGSRVLSLGTGRVENLCTTLG